MSTKILCYQQLFPFIPHFTYDKTGKVKEEEVSKISIIQLLEEIGQA